VEPNLATKIGSVNTAFPFLKQCTVNNARVLNKEKRANA